MTLIVGRCARLRHGRERANAPPSTLNAARLLPVGTSAAHLARQHAVRRSTLPRAWPRSTDRHCRAERRGWGAVPTASPPVDAFWKPSLRSSDTLKESIWINRLTSNTLYCYPRLTHWFFVKTCNVVFHQTDQNNDGKLDQLEVEVRLLAAQLGR